MKRFFALTLAIGLSGILCQQIHAQGEDSIRSIKKEISVSIEDGEDDPVYRIKIITDTNGKTNTIEKTYRSLEEMEADSSLSIIDQLPGLPDDTKEGRTKIMMDNHKPGQQQYIFITQDGDSSKQVEKIEISVALDDEDSDDVREKKIVISKVNEDSVISGDTNTHKVLVWVDDDGEENKSKGKIRVIDETSSIHSAEISDVDKDSEKWSAFNLDQMPELKLKSIHYFPNPNEGEFTLTFSGRKKPVTVRILDKKGNVKFEDIKKDFNEYYNRAINVKKYAKGSYLLQVFQEGKIFSKEIIIK